MQVFDKEIIGKDNLIGRGTHSLNVVMAMQNESCWVPLKSYKGKDCGMVNLSLNFQPMV